MSHNELYRLGGFYGQATRWGVYHPNYIAPTLVAAMGEGGGHVPMVLINEDINNRQSKVVGFKKE